MNPIQTLFSFRRALFLTLALALAGCSQEKRNKPWIVTDESAEQEETMGDRPENETMTEEEKAVLAEDRPQERTDNSLYNSLTADEKKIIHATARKQPVEGFERVFTDCYRSYRRQLKSTRRKRQHTDVRQLPEYGQLCAMGEAIIPLLMEKMLDTRNLFALKLYEDIQTDSSLKIAVKKQPDEAKRLIQTIHLWTGRQQRAQQ